MRATINGVIASASSICHTVRFARRLYQGVSIMAPCQSGGETSRVTPRRKKIGLRLPRHYHRPPRSVTVLRRVATGVDVATFHAKAWSPIASFTLHIEERARLIDTAYATIVWAYLGECYDTVPPTYVLSGRQLDTRRQQDRYRSSFQEAADATAAEDVAC